jgi:phage internal scaffolding protein
MGRVFRELIGVEGESKTSPEMREFCQRPGRTDEKGRPIYFTEQHHKNECDVNEIIKKYDKEGLISHITKIEAKFGDLTGADFKNAMDLITNSQSMFNQLPPEIRARFKNSPEHLLNFMEDPNNRNEAIQLGLIPKSFPEHLDGLGEHVTDEKVKERDKIIEKNENPE